MRYASDMRYAQAERRGSTVDELASVLDYRFVYKMSNVQCPMPNARQ